MKRTFFKSLTIGAAALSSMLFLVQFETHAQERQRAAPPATSPKTSVSKASPRDAFVGRWSRYGTTDFFPNEIVFEPDPASADGLLITFTLGCQYKAPACSAVKVKSAQVFMSGEFAMAAFNWFKDSADNTYEVSFQIMPADAQLVKGASKEINAIFGVRPSFNRTALFSGTMPNELRYDFKPPTPSAVPSAATKPAEVTPAAKLPPQQQRAR
jgi:hypothetical protein